MKFLNGALRYLNGLYRFAGGQVATDRMDLEGSIQLVHDASREAELASGIGRTIAPGYWLLGPANTHPGADTQFNAYNPRTTIQSTAGFTQLPEYDVWLLPGTYAWSATNAAISAALSTIWYPPLPGQSVATQRAVMFASGRITAPSIGGTVGGDVAVALNGATLPDTNEQPILLPIGTTIANMTVSLLAADIQVVSPVWVGAPGARPPGLA